MDESIRTILDPLVLTTSYSQRPNMRPTPIADWFYRNPEPIEGDSYRLFFDPAENRPAPLNNPGSEARVLQGSDAQEKFATLFQAFNKIPLQGNVLAALREPDSPTLQEMGRTEIGRQQGKFRERHRIMKELCMAKTLTAGIVYLDEKGAVLESSSGAVISADFGVAAGHQSQLDYDGGGDIIGTTWSNAAADIQKDLNDIDDAAEASNVPAPTDVWCHKSMKDNLRNNTDFQTWAAASAADSEAILRGNVIEGLFGKDWHFVGHKYENSSGTMTNYIGTTLAILTPPATDPWHKPTAGSQLVPNGVGIYDNWEQALADSEKVFGEFSYAKLIDDPWTLFLYMGDTWGWHFVDPNAIWQATAVF